MASGVNLKEFTLAVDQAAQKMDQGLPQLLIHSIARKIPEERAQALYDYFSISFPRHSAFHAELRENGMKDTRKNKTR